MRLLVVAAAAAAFLSTSALAQEFTSRAVPPTAGSAFAHPGYGAATRHPAPRDRELSVARPRHVANDQPGTGAGAQFESTSRDPSSDVICVAQAVYHEARGEPMRGQRAVADVVMNRVRSGRWSRSACGVVSAPGQFEHFARWSIPQVGDEDWVRAIAIARDAVAGVVSISPRFMSFHTVRLGGRGWTRIGGHVFL